MPLKLITTVNKIKYVPNHVNATIIDDFYQYMKSNGSSEYQYWVPIIATAITGVG